MAIFRVLEPAGYDRVLWQQFFNALPSRYRLIHFSPSYARTQALASGDHALCAVAQDELSSEFVMLPFIMRNTAGLCSVESFYGYGGPVSNVHGAPAMSLAVQLEERLMDWRAEHHVLCERTVLQPYLADFQQALVPWVGKLVKQVVMIPTVDVPAAHSLMRDTRRHEIAKARKRGLKVAVTTSRGAPLTRFVELYRATMKRKGASTNWELDQSHFDNIMAELAGNVVLVSVSNNERIVSAAMVLVNARHAHYQYAGNGLEEQGASDLLVSQAITVANACGCEWLDLGGGVTADPADSVLFYKSSFSKERRPVVVGTRVFDKHAFDEAAARFPQTSFFPPWRA
jgi:serine/alanine adding enzyme